ncbi:MAG: hypothetical protein OZ930_15845, partial [Ignavibacteria bacterium]|nr:hypothetical protein [Ignavibacteria bacterium]
MMLVNKISLAITIIMWIVFAIGFLLLKRRQKQNEQKKNKLAMIGMMLEGVGFAFVFTVRREPFTNIFQMNSSIQILLTIFSGILAIASVWLGLSAVKTLGKQWNIKAQIIEGH